MTKDVKKSVERLIWRFRKDKEGDYIQFKPNNNDFNELLNIIGWIEQQKELSLLNNDLFAKLFIHVLNQNIEYYNTDVLEEEPQKEISRLLSTPLKLFYKAFHSKIQSVHINRILERTKKENSNEITKQELREFFDLDFVTEQLNHMITEAINKFSKNGI